MSFRLVALIFITYVSLMNEFIRPSGWGQGGYQNVSIYLQRLEVDVGCSSNTLFLETGSFTELGAHLLARPSDRWGPGLHLSPFSHVGVTAIHLTFLCGPQGSELGSSCLSPGPSPTEPLPVSSWKLPFSSLFHNSSLRCLKGQRRQHPHFCLKPASLLNIRLLTPFIQKERDGW